VTLLLVALGAALGTPLRYLTDQALRARAGTGFPWGTLTVNIAGSGLLGFLAAVPAGDAVMAAAGTGFCGALTTYSTFSYETLRLARDGDRARAARYVAASIGAGLAAAYAGLALAGAVTG
jgi:fluoride exporter